MEGNTTEQAKSQEEITYASGQEIQYGSACQVCSEFQRGEIVVFMCTKCGEALKKLIMEKRALLGG